MTKKLNCIVAITSQQIKSEMDVDQFFRNSYFSFSRIILSISGFWPFDSKVKRYVIYFAVLLVCKPVFVFQILGAMDVLHYPIEFVNSLCMIVLYGIIYFKIFCGIYMIPKIKLLFTKIQEYHLSPKSKKECEIYNSYAMWGRKMNLAYFWIVCFHDVIFHVSTYLAKIMETNPNKNDTVIKIQRGIIHQVNYLVDFDTYYVLIFIHTTICNILLIYMAIMFDILYVTIVEHSRGLFASLRYRLENTSSDNDYNFSMNTFKINKSYLNIAYSARRHAEVIEFVDLVNTAYNAIQLAHVGFAIIILAILEFQIVVSIEEGSNFLKPFNYFCAILMNIFFENWHGQRVLDSSTKVFTAACNSEWYSMPLVSRKLFRLIVMRSINPSVLMAGKFFALSYESFNAVVRTSSSYFMLLRSIT